MGLTIKLDLSHTGDFHLTQTQLVPPHPMTWTQVTTQKTCQHSYKMMHMCVSVCVRAHSDTTFLLSCCLQAVYGLS